METHTSSGKRLFDGVDSDDGDAIAWYNSVTEIAVTVELNVTRQLTVRHSFRRLLQLQQLIINTSTFLRNNKEWIHGTLGTSSLITVSHNTINTSTNKHQVILP